ncbi:MAG: helix-turn-helix domain-containing protein [Arthrobacter sp.]|jgi:AraC-like DNA-binding protein|nr:helix-turn-helix domain-containing protein [Arthrobacter sp.]
MTQRLVRSHGFGDTLIDWGYFDEAPPSAAREHPGEGGLIRGELGTTELDLITIEAPRLAVSRTTAHVRSAPGPRHILTVQLRGESVLAPSDGAEPILLAPGEVGYWDSQMPYRWDFTGPVELLMLRVPFASLELAPAALSAVRATRLAVDAGHAGLAVDFARGALAHPTLFHGPLGTRALGDVARLFTTLLATVVQAAGASERGAPAFARAVEFIGARLGEPLTLAGIAAATGMAPRTLQGLFQERGTTVTAWIRLRRLEAARAALADPAHAGRTLADLASSFGFADHAHLARSFRATYGETPSAWRARALRG